MDIVTKIVDRIRSQTEFILGFGMPSKYIQPLESDQYKIIDNLIKEGVFIDIVAKSGFLIEGGGSYFAKTSFFDHEEIFDELRKSKSIIFYFWGVMPGENYDKLRYARSSTVIHPLERYRKV
jgi:hypothetical protein